MTEPFDFIPGVGGIFDPYRPGQLPIIRYNGTEAVAVMLCALYGTEEAMHICHLAVMRRNEKTEWFGDWYEVTQIVKFNREWEQIVGSLSEN
jgi:hypothetical protein